MAVVAVAAAADSDDVALRHLIHHPQEFVVDQIPQGAALKITDSTGTTTLVSLLRRQSDSGAQGS